MNKLIKEVACFLNRDEANRVNNIIWMQISQILILFLLRLGENENTQKK